MKKSGGTERVERYLRRQLRALGPGEVLPSFRIVAKDCQVSPLTASQVVKDYGDNNLLVVRPQRGIFMPDQFSPRHRELIRVRQIDILHIGLNMSEHQHDAFRQDLICHLNEEPSKRGYSGRIHGIKFGPEGIDQIREIAEESSVEACIIVRLAEPGQLEPLRQANIPYVCLYPECPDVPESNSVLIQQESIPQMQMEYLVSLGHRRIGFLHNVDPHRFQRGQLVRREAFFRTALDLDLPVDSSLVQYGGMNPDVQRQGIAKILDNPKRPTAVICSDAHLAEVYRAARERNLVIGKDLSVLGTNDEPVAQTIDPPASTVYVPRLEAVQSAIDLLEVALRSADAHCPNRYVNARIVARHSTGPMMEAAAPGHGQPIASSQAT